MTNKVALWLGVALLALLAIDLAFGLEWHIALGRRFLDLIRAVAIWR